MRKELYKMLCERLKTVPAIKHIDLWNHNVEFIEQEQGWERPAVFVEFCPIAWEATVNGVRYVATPQVRLHIVTDWKGSTSADSELMDEALDVFELCDEIHGALCLMEGSTFQEFDLVESQTCHNHEEILENIEVYQCTAIRQL